MMGCISKAKDKQVENLTRRSSIISQSSSIDRSIRHAYNPVNLMRCLDNLEILSDRSQIVQKGTWRTHVESSVEHEVNSINLIRHQYSLIKSIEQRMSRLFGGASRVLRLFGGTSKHLKKFIEESKCR